MVTNFQIISETGISHMITNKQILIKITFCKVLMKAKAVMKAKPVKRIMNDQFRGGSAVAQW